MPAIDRSRSLTLPYLALYFVCLNTSSRKYRKYFETWCANLCQLHVYLCLRFYKIVVAENEIVIKKNDDIPNNQ